MQLNDKSLRQMKKKKRTLRTMSPTCDFTAKCRLRYNVLQCKHDFLHCVTSTTQAHVLSQIVCWGHHRLTLVVLSRWLATQVHCGEKRPTEIFLVGSPSIITNDKTTALTHSYCGAACFGKVAAKSTVMPIIARTSATTLSCKRKY